MKIANLRERVINGLYELVKSNVLTWPSLDSPYLFEEEVHEDLLLLYLLMGNFTKQKGSESYYVSLEPFDIKAQFPFTNTNLKYRWLLLFLALYPKDSNESWRSWYNKIYEKYSAFGFNSISKVISMELPKDFDNIDSISNKESFIEVLAVSAYEDTGQYNTIKLEYSANPYKLILENEEVVNPELLFNYITNLAKKPINLSKDSIDLVREINEGLNPDFPLVKSIPPYTIFNKEVSDNAKDIYL